MQFAKKTDRISRRFFSPLLFLVLVGCGGGKPATVTGIVTIDGKPLSNGTVTYSPAGGGMKAIGLIKSDGSYQIKTNSDAGIDIGEYDVAVVSREVISSGPDSPPMPGKYVAPKHYGNMKTSGLHYQVEKGSNQIDIDLSSEDSRADR